jgi:hypothetical protein
MNGSSLGNGTKWRRAGADSFFKSLLYAMLKRNNTHAVCHVICQFLVVFQVNSNHK